MSMSNTLGKLIAEVRAEKGLDMKDKLEYLIQKAVDGGWQPFEFGNPTSITQWHNNNTVGLAVVFPLHKHPVEWVRELEGIVFNHEFAKALFGEEIWVRLSAGLFEEEVKPDRAFMPSIHKPLWQHHLQQAVINEDPITYLYNAVKAIEGEKK